MADFGNVITDGTSVATGAYGYVAKFNLANYLVKTVKQVQLQTTTGPALSSPSSTPTDITVLYGYPQLVTCPNFAWHQDKNIVHVFCKSSVYPYTSATRIGFWMFRSSIDMAIASSMTDVSSDKKELYRYLVLEAMYITEGERVPFGILNGIFSECQRLGL